MIFFIFLVVFFINNTGETCSIRLAMFNRDFTIDFLKQLIKKNKIKNDFHTFTINRSQTGDLTVVYDVSMYIRIEQVFHWRLDLIINIKVGF